MKIKMLKLSCKPEGHKFPGREYEVTEAEGMALIADRAAEPVGLTPAQGKKLAEDLAAQKAERAKAVADLKEKLAKAKTDDDKAELQRQIDALTVTTGA